MQWLVETVVIDAQRNELVTMKNGGEGTRKETACFKDRKTVKTVCIITGIEVQSFMVNCKEDYE
jgi:hypothetical protein